MLNFDKQLKRPPIIKLPEEELEPSRICPRSLPLNSPQNSLEILSSKRSSIQPLKLNRRNNKSTDNIFVNKTYCDVQYDLNLSSVKPRTDKLCCDFSRQSGRREKKGEEIYEPNAFGDTKGFQYMRRGRVSVLNKVAKASKKTGLISFDRMLSRQNDRKHSLPLFMKTRGMRISLNTFNSKNRRRMRMVKPKVNLTEMNQDDFEDSLCEEGSVSRILFAHLID